MKKKINLIFIVLIIISMTFALRASNNMLFTMVPLLGKYYLNFTTWQIGILSSLFGVFPFLVSAFLNAKLKSSSRKKFFVFSAFLYFASFIMFYYSNSVNIWFLVSIAGFSLGALMPNIITAAGLCEDRLKRERIIAIYTITLSTSLIIGPIIESFLLKFVNLRESFLIFAIFPFIAFLMSFFIQFPDESKAEAEKVMVIKNPYFLAAIISILIYNIPFATLIAFGGIYAKDVFGLDISTINLYFSLFFTSSFLGRLYLVIKPPEKIFHDMIFSGILTIGGIFLMIISNSPFIFAVSLFILGFPHGFTFVLSLISLSRGFDVSQRNIANSYFFSTVNIIGTLTPLIFGYILNFINIKMLFYLLLPFALVFLSLLVLKLKSSKFI
ncbi:MAG: MFS transporter [Desulfurella sp.]|uniref:MFS transporter n=1 Tax=Desulfurella sp. TaxID=1962857 RepID=UPI000CB70AD0|nr:MFS transporter [Desulfurella sp.]PMP89879.1 MAG: MFS transporter [Desulfurella sp.]